MTSIGTFNLDRNRANELYKDHNNTTFAYDARGWRVKKHRTVGATHTVYYVYDSQHRLMARWDNGVETDFVYLGRKPIARIDASNTRYIHDNYQHSPLFETDSTATITRTPEFWAYGQPINADALNNTPGYTGATSDLATGLLYLGARYLNPPRFLSPDPAGLDPTSPTGLNRYAYAYDNPTRYVDPEGMEGKAPCNEACMRMRRLADHFSGPTTIITHENSKDRLSAAQSYMEVAAPAITGTYTSPSAAAQAFSNAFAKISGILKLEFGANIVFTLTGAYGLQDFIISNKFTTDGIGAAITPIGRPSPVWWGFIHSHPNNTHQFSSGDIRYLLNVHENGVVVSPDGTINFFIFSKYIKSGMPSYNYVYYNQDEFGAE